MPVAKRERLVVHTLHVEGAPVVTVRAVLHGGARVEQIPGQALVTGRLLAEGTTRRDWRAIAEDTEARGMALAAAGSVEALGVAIEALADDWERALEWVAELVLEPSFPADRCDWLARQTAAELESLADQPDLKTSWSFLEQLYDPHPLARRLQGDKQSLARLDPEHCRAFHQASLAAGLTVVLAGLVPADEVRRAAERVFRAAAGPARPWPEPPPPRGLPAARQVVPLEARDQAHLFLGHLTVPRNHPDTPALEALAVILGAGSGLVGRIPRRIREREGLAYVAQANTVSGAGLDQGRFVAYVGTSPATVAQAEAGLVEEIERLLEDGVSEDEVADARSYLLGREPFRRETARQWVELMLESEIYGVPCHDLEWRRQCLAALDRAAVEAAARRHLKPHELKVTIGLPEA